MSGFGPLLLFAATFWGLIFVGIIVVVSLIASRKTGQKYTTENEKTYAKLWAASETSHILALAATTERINLLKTVHKNPTHRYRNVVGSPNSRFAKFEDVFHRARLLKPLVDTKSKQWFEMLCKRFDRSCTDSGICRMPAPLKTHQRAIDKIWRCYQGNVDLLVDIVRTAIVCDSLEQVEFLSAILLADKEVSIKRCKNRFHPTYDSTKTAGYRDVAFNLRLKSAESVEQGLDGMIFEVQLLIKSVHDVKNDTGHDNYNILRMLAAN
jgi:hypothetical protein